jgi:hypothetical protein
MRLKLLSPVDTADAVANQLKDEYAAKARLLSEDGAKIARIESQLEEARGEMRSNFQRFILEVDKQVTDLRDRGVDFLDRSIRLRNINLLRNESRFREEFEREVLADWRRELDRTLNESVDWLVRGNMGLWNNTLDYFNSQVRRAEYDPLILGKVGGHFVYERDQVHSRIRREAEARIKSLDHREECRRVIDGAMNAIQKSFGLGAGAVGLGYVLATAFTTVALDVTGVTAAALLFATSFFILPYKRKRAIEELRTKIEQLRADLRRAFEEESSREISRAVDNVQAAIEPYTRFVRSEQSKVEQSVTALTEIRERLAVIRQEVRRALGSDGQ